MATDALELRIRDARPEEAQVLTQIAHAAKRSWGYPEEWITLWKQALTVTPDSLHHRHTFVAELQQQAVGFIGCELAPPIVEVEHLWVLPEHMHRKIGRQLWERAVVLCREIPRPFLRPRLNVDHHDACSLASCMSPSSTLPGNLLDTPTKRLPTLPKSPQGRRS